MQIAYLSLGAGLRERHGRAFPRRRQDVAAPRRARAAPTRAHTHSTRTRALLFPTSFVACKDIFFFFFFFERGYALSPHTKHLSGSLKVGDALAISGPWGMIEYVGRGKWLYGKREIARGPSLEYSVEFFGTAHQATHCFGECTRKPTDQEHVFTKAFSLRSLSL